MNDTDFIRGAIPMTKSEVRAVSLSKLEVEAGSIVFDIGAGTGSVSVEAALLARQGQVFSFEQKEEGCDLIRANADRHGVHNITVVPGRVPETLAGYPVPDRVFLGGSGGQIEPILEQLFAQNPNVRVVMNVIALETLSQVIGYLKAHGPEHDLEHEIISMQVARAEMRGGYHLMQGQNPVYIITMESRKPEPVSEQRQSCRSVMPRILLAAPASGSGKTVLTTGLLALLKQRGHHCVSFKCGPDYIDPMFHRYVLDIPGCNLDSFFLEEDSLKRLLAHNMTGADLAVIEGVMGYYDGIAGNSLRASTYEIACITDTPVILVMDGKKSSLSLAAQLKGFMTYQKDSHIAGVILNRTSPVMLERLRPVLEELGVCCIGAVPECEEAALESRHLGLTIPAEQKELQSKIARLAKKLEVCLDVEMIENLASHAGMLKTEVLKTRTGVKAEKRQPLHRMGVAMDEAFCFYYQENLDFLQELGWELVFFSPLRDAQLPECLDGLLLGGGYPENYARELSQNQSMCLEIRQAAERGVKLLAECGGFLYLHRTLEGTDGTVYPMAGVIPADGFRTKKLSRFGYVSLGPDGDQIRAHEFHYWDSTAPGKDWTARKPGTERSWSCMYVTASMLAGFPHLYYRSNPNWMKTFLEEGTTS